MPTRQAAAAATALAAVLVVVGVLAAALVGPLSLQGTPDVPVVMPELTELPVLPSDTPPSEQTADQEPPTTPWWAVWVVRVVQVLAVALLGLALFLLLRHAARGWRFDRGTDDEDDVPPGDGESSELSVTAVAALREGVAAATRALDEDVPPGDAVIGAWVAVETAAARTGVERDRAQTASEFAVDVLGATRADPAATRELLGLYLEARFGAHPVTVDDVRRARDLLAVVARGLVPRDEQDGPATQEPAP
ncbi:DUF4129 domain-containing protein [Cellulomonas wangsupingiae]|uniref:DUF4129 domain-containing protein n=1 Tax=Cellulomonas wangsupingiae TaxID=2968085 RepID=A0ABY5K3B5_9CELL|nr:DUF4129 domain-containing protein [Cellulomonas wangsupingiae]MCC2333687.1 DUF4129 domain-containing protein [Cellulomonas wangsupingiae]UUI64952.1 DUF4129 domain-containing protein [Cellulomonas wangsupingiae]